MGSRFLHYFFRGAASALFACATPAFADPVDDPANLPQWMQRAQQRLALTPSQQRELRELAEQNTSSLAVLQRRLELKSGDVAARDRQDVIAGLQREFRAGLSTVLSPAQLTEWDALLQELLGEFRRPEVTALAGRQH